MVSVETRELTHTGGGSFAHIRRLTREKHLVILHRKTSVLWYRQITVGAWHVYHTSNDHTTKNEHCMCITNYNTHTALFFRFISIIRVGSSMTAKKCVCHQPLKNLSSRHLSHASLHFVRGLHSSERGGRSGSSLRGKVLPVSQSGSSILQLRDLILTSLDFRRVVN